MPFPHYVTGHNQQEYTHNQYRTLLVVYKVSVKKRTISYYTYTVDRNRVNVDVGVDKRKISFDIEDPDVWEWLIVKKL